MLDGVRSQDTKLPAIAMLLRGMRAFSILDVQWAVSMIAIKGIRALICMAVRILHSKVLVEDWVVIVEAGEVEASLGWESMMGEVGLAMLNYLRCFRLEREGPVCIWELLVKDGFGLHSRDAIPCDIRTRNIRRGSPVC